MKHLCLRILSALLCAALAVVLSGCGARSRQPQESLESMPPAATQESSAEQPVEPELTGLAAVAKACAPIVKTFPASDDGGYCTPTDADYQALLNAVGALGVPAVCYGLDPVNREEVDSFWTDAQAQKEGSIQIYCIYNFAVYEEAFGFMDGKFSRTTTVWNYNSVKPEESSPTAPLDSFKLTDKGYLLYQENAEDFEMGSGNGFRIAPLGEENRALCKKYVQPVDAMVLGVTSRNWSKDHFSGIDWEFTYECLYQTVHKTHFSKAYPPVDPAGLPYCKIPAADVETLLQQYFTVPAEELHKLKSYDAQNQAYLFTGFLGGGYSPTAEVVGKTINADGSFTLTIQFAAPEFGRDCDSTSLLTILPSADGSWRYLSNETDNPRGNEPNFHDRSAS